MSISSLETDKVAEILLNIADNYKNKAFLEMEVSFIF